MFLVKVKIEIQNSLTKYCINMYNMEKKNYIKAPQIVGNLFQKFKRKCEEKKWCEKIGERK